VRHPAYRLRKYDAKMDPDSIRARFLAHRDTMVEQEEAIFGEIVLVETKAKRVLEASGVASIQIPAYLNFARQCYSLGKRFSGTTLSNEVLNWFNHWQSRGLIGTILAKIADLCGVAIAGYS